MTLQQYKNKLGLTNQDIKIAFDVSELTVTKWLESGAPKSVLDKLKGFSECQ